MIDLVIWTYNSERYLRKVLERAASVVPDSELEQLILVDGGSQDNTVKIGREMGWKTYVSKKGIPFQANCALSHVKAPYFGSLEHDVLLSKNWYSLIKHFDKPDVGVVQGVRFSTHPSLYRYEKHCLRKSNIQNFCVSLDNHIYETDFLRKIGGFPTKSPFAVDRELVDRVQSNERKWEIDLNVESTHIRDSLWGTIKHDYKLYSGIQRKDQLAKFDEGLKSYSYTPVSALRLVKATKDPMLIPYFMSHKFVRFAVLIQRYSTIKNAKKLIQ